MAVPKSERKESQIAFLQLAEDLQDLTNKIIMNEKYIPKKYRYVWSQEVFALSMHIYENVRRANILYPRDKETLDRRLDYVRLAESDSEALLSQISFARRTFKNIPNSLQEEWEKLCTKEKRAIRERYNDDKERFKNLT